MRVLIIGTYPSQTTGYSKVVYNIAKQMSRYTDIRLTIFGIQKFTDINDNYRLDVPDNVALWNVVKHDENDFGFGTQSLKNFVLVNDPDVVMVYNDAEVIKRYIMNLNLIRSDEEARRMNINFKIVAYLDQVHKTQNPESIQYIAQNTEHVFCFTEDWRQNYLSYLRIQKDYLPDFYRDRCSVVKHGIKDISQIKNTDVEVCKNELNFDKNSFIFVNLNRFATKKRLDISVISFVKFLKKTNSKNAFLYFPAISNKDKNSEILKSIYRHELKLNSLEGFENNLIIRTDPLSDEDIEKIYIASEVGLNSCDGEGFGLCNYEHAALGRPQIITKVGGLVDYFNENNSIPCLPKYRSYTDENEMSEVIDPEDMANGMVKYYQTRSFYNKHSVILKEIPKKYRWDIEIEKMVKVWRSVC
jgi:hypothetical protein